MKKLLIALALGLVLVLALATVASADYGPHGRFNGSTQACASCHRAHSAASSADMLLTYDTVWALCTSCHNGTGAYTNVVDGYYDTGDTSLPGTHGERSLADTMAGGVSIKTSWSNKTGQANMGLYGGGFVHARMLTDYGTSATQMCSTNQYSDCTTLTQAVSPLGGVTTAYWDGTANNQYNPSAEAWAVKNKYDGTLGLPTGRNVTSAHKVGQIGLLTAEFTNSYASEAGTVWGGGTYRTVAGGYTDDAAGAAASAAADGTLTLECTSCHTPHGAGGLTGGVESTTTAGNGLPTPSYRLLNFSPEGESYELDPIVTVNYTNVQPSGNNYTFARLYWDQPSVLGVTVPDPTVKWYTPNSDAAYDARARSYRSSSYWMANFAGPGDYGGIYFAYMRPSTISGIVCPATETSDASGTNLPVAGITACTTALTAAATTAGYPLFDNTPAQNVMGFWCATCHDRYLAPGGGGITDQTNLTGNANAADLAWLVAQQADGNVSTGGTRTTDSGDVAYHYRHRSQGVVGQVSTAGSMPASFTGTGAEYAPTTTTLGNYAMPAGVIGWRQGVSSQSATYSATSGGAPNGQYTCLSCHNAHGTVAQATALSQSGTYSDSSALLKADNRAICLRCHVFDVNLFNTVTTPNAILIKP